MRADPIIIQGIGIERPIACRRPMASAAAFKRKEPKSENLFRADGTSMNRPAIQGWAALHDKAFQHEGRFVFLKSGCFIDTIFDGRRKPLLLDHEVRREVGATESGLEFANSLIGLAFRFPLSGNDAANQIADTVGNGERACVSVSIVFEEFETRKVEGYDLDYVTKARLEECSLVTNGAIANTYAKVVDLEHEDEMLWRACRAPGFATAQAVASITKGVRRITEALRRA